jgi:hypothetical protein
MTPAEVEALFERDLRFVPARGRRTALLVADELVAGYSRKFQRYTGRYRAAPPGARAHRASVVMFILLPQVRLRKRFDVDAPTARAQAGLFDALAARLMNER